MSQELTKPTVRSRHAEAIPSLLLPIGFIAFVMVLLASTLPYITTTSSMQRSSPSYTGGFSLIGGDGQAVTDRSWPGKFLLVYFGYTHCPDLCPTMLSSIAGALNDLGRKADRVQALFVTIDPQRDTPAVMKQYTALFSTRIAGLTGTPAELAAAAKDYGVRYLRQQTGPAADDYEMEHTSYAYLVYPSGDLALTISPGQTSREMASELASQLE
jgi:protein SCO1